MPVIDVDQSSIEAEVIERSRSVPVVVDFWAEWCGPCRALTPLLEAATARRGEDVVLAKLDTDANQEIARSFGIQGIPAVKAFRDGAVVDEFVGAQPPAMVERFFDGLVPSESDRLVAAGDEASLRRALELTPARADATLALARLLIARGETDAALELLDNVAGDYQAAGLAARLRLQQRGLPELEQAFAKLDRGDTAEAIDLLLDALGADDGDRDEIRKVIVGELDVLGPDDQLARDARRRLAAALY
jgi:putative thioredoxin